MKPPIEYRPKPVPVAQRKERQVPDLKAASSTPAGDANFIVIRRDRAKYNAYMRAYRAKKKAEKNGRAKD